MRRDTKIAVIGAGLGGMTTAAFLQRAGFNVRVFEQAPSFSRIGAGIILSPNATGVLKQLGLEDLLVSKGIKAGCYVSRTWDTGLTTYQIDFDEAFEETYDAPYVDIHRGDLHAILDTALEPGSVSFDHKLLAIAGTKDAPELLFENGTRERVDLVIGADGLNSKVRETIFGVQPPRFTKAAALRSIFPTSNLRGFSIPDCTKWWGIDRHLLAYFLTSKRDEVYLVGIVPWMHWDTEQSFLPSSREFMLEAFDGFHEDLQRLLSVAEDVTLWPIFDRPRNDTWYEGRIVLLGDACHPVPPYMGAGGVMAIEDGAVLSRCITQFDAADEALRAFKSSRIDRVGAVQRISWENSWMRGPTDTDWFYRHNPCAAPLMLSGAS